MPYCRLYYHIVWAPKLRAPLLTPEVEPIIHGYCRSKAVGLGATVYALNGVEDLVHLVVTLPPSISIGKFVGQVKAVASTRFNRSGAREASFSRQAEYAAFAFDRRRLENHVAYVVRQKEDHRDRQLIPVLERVGSEGGSTVAEALGVYATEDQQWRDEMMGLEP